MEGADGQHPNIVALVGLSGAGKSTVARRLAARWGWRALDLDAQIASTARCSIPEIFENHGESEFRRLERDALMRALGEAKIVLATGGGAPCQPGAMEVLLDHATVVWLDARPETLAARLEGAEDRPLLLADDHLKVLSEQHQVRAATYVQAHLRVAVDDRDVDTIVEDIVAELGGRQ